MLALLLSVAFAEDWAPGEMIPNAATLDITPEGFDAVAAAVPALIPSDIAIPETGTSGSILGFCDYGFGLANGSAHVQVVSADITPQNGVLSVDAKLMVSINDASNPFNLSYEYCFGDSSCGGYVTPFDVDIHTTMNLEVVDDGSGGRKLDATLGAIEYTYGLTGDNIELDCWIQGLKDFLGYLNLSIYDLIISLVAPQLESTIADLGPTLESTIEDAFASANIHQELDLNGATLTLDLRPSDVDITPDGVRVTLEGDMDAPAAACVAAYDPGGSLKTLTNPPDISTLPSGAHAALQLSDDFLNELLYAVWRGGVLCIDTNSLSLPISLDTALLGTLTGNVFTDLFPTPQPVVLRTAPVAPLTANFTGTDDLDVNVDQLGLEFYADLDGRKSRLANISMDGQIGANIAFDGTTGNMAIELVLGADSLKPTVVYNELKPDQNAEIEAAFGPAFGNLASTLIGNLVGDSLAFALPSFSGLGLTSITVEGKEDWLGAFIQLGTVTYGADGSGCSSCGGGCSGGTGCTIGGTTVPFAAAWLPALAVLVARRRRV